MNEFVEVLFSEEFWLPSNVSWSDVDEAGSNFSDILSSVSLCVLILVVRYTIERCFLWRIAIAHGLRNNKTKIAAPNDILEKVYLKHKKSTSAQLRGLAKQLDWNERQVQEWIRHRLSQDKATKIDKFCESGWRFLYYLSIFCFGWLVLKDSTWMWDIEKCWTHYPHHFKTSGIWWYYMVSLAFYLSLSITQFCDINRSDFWQMFVHHIITIFLLVYSWNVRLFRIGSLVLLVHDFADISLEAAKVTKYLGYKKLCNVVFAFFTISWIGSRIIVYPFWIMKSILVDAPKHIGYFPGLLIFISILFLLLFLHVFWTGLLIKLVYQTLTTKKIKGDIRSSSSEDD